MWDSKTWRIRKRERKKTYPQATSSKVIFPFVSWLISSLKLSKTFLLASTSIGKFSLLPKILGKCSGNNLPKTKLASVIVAGPPFLIAAAPGSLPALWGPEENNPFLQVKILPPPAPTVFIFSWGDWIIIPAVVDSKTTSYSPSYLETSLEVPPTSNAIIGNDPGAKQVKAEPDEAKVVEWERISRKSKKRRK